MTGKMKILLIYLPAGRQGLSTVLRICTSPLSIFGVGPGVREIVQAAEGKRPVRKK